MRFGPVRMLALLIVLLAGGLAWLWVDQHGQWRNVVWLAPKALPPDLKVPASPLQPDATANNPALFAAILARPMFAPDRRPPPPPPPPAVAPPPDPLANIQILGVFSGASPGILARVDGKVRRIKVAETVGPWTLKSIDGRDITFAQGDENRQLRLAYARLDTPRPQAATAAAPPPGSPAAGDAVIMQNRQDESRDILRRRNAARAAKGLSPVPE